jgi:tetratricopeptide (TPR) repeat protein
MIVGGNEDYKDLDRCLKSVDKQVDKIFIVLTSKNPNKELIEVCKKYDAVYELKEFYHTVTKSDVKFIKKIGLTPNMKVGEKLFEFDKARNYAMQMVPKDYEWLLWLDTDDVLRGDQLREIVADAEKNQLDSVFFNYIYQAEIVDGKIKHIMIEHLRERLIRNNDLFKWVAPIHETLVEVKPTRKKDDDRCDVLHLSNTERRLKAINRNIGNLEYSLITTNAKDPRPIYYLGKAYFDLWQTENKEKYLKDAKTLFETYLSGSNPSGWAEERSQCWEYLVEIYRSLGEYNNAIKCAHNAMIEDERFPSIYVNLALCYCNKKEWGRALWWIRRVSKMEQPNSTLVSSPRDLMARTMEVIYHASLNLSKLDEAFAASVKLREIYPDRQDILDRYKMVSQLREQRDITKLFIQLASYLEQTNQSTKLKPLIMATPDLIRGNPFVVDLEKKVNPPRLWGKDEVCIYCGPAFTQWGPKQLDEPGESFVGGSEEAVIYLSKELQKQGWKVSVYGDPGEGEGEYEGVSYLSYFKFNPRDTFNILVSWRRPDLVDQNMKTVKTYIWCHDIQNQLDYTPERLSKIAKIIVLSPWHRTNLPDIPDDKIFISSNGIDL